MASPRRQLLVAQRAELEALAREFDAEISVTGSVARGEEAEAGERPDKPRESDIDLYIENFSDAGDAPTNKLRAIEFVRRLHLILSPYKVDAYPLPDRVIDEDYLDGFRKDAIALGSLEE